MPFALARYRILTRLGRREVLLAQDGVLHRAVPIQWIRPAQTFARCAATDLAALLRDEQPPARARATRRPRTHDGSACSTPVHASAGGRGATAHELLRVQHLIRSGSWFDRFIPFPGSQCGAAHRARPDDDLASGLRKI